MDAFLKEQQAFALLFRMGVVGREEWREWLRQEYNIPMAPPVTIEVDDAVAGVHNLGMVVEEMVDARMSRIFFEAEQGDTNEAQAEQNGPGPQVTDELTDEELQRLAEEG